MDPIEVARQRPAMLQSRASTNSILDSPKQRIQIRRGNSDRNFTPVLRKGVSERSVLGGDIELDDGQSNSGGDESVASYASSVYSTRRNNSFGSIVYGEKNEKKKYNAKDQVFVLRTEDWKSITAKEMQERSPKRKNSTLSAKIIQATHSKKDSELTAAARQRMNAIREKAIETDYDQQVVNFYDIVDDVETGHRAHIDSMELLISRLVESRRFQQFILLVIILNTITIGLNTNQYIVRQYSSTLDILDNVFLTIFVVEQVLKLKLGVYAFFRDGWNTFDFSLVAVSVLGTVIKDVGTRRTVGGRVLRLLRVLRAFRTLRILGAIQKLQIVVSTFLKSLVDLANIVMLTIIMMFIFAVIGVQMLGQELPDDFGDLSLSMYTLWILITQDGWVLVWRRMEAVSAPDFPILPAFYFGFFIVVGAWVFMNVISGVTVTNWQQYVQQSRQLVKEKYRHIPTKRSAISSFVHHEGDRITTSDNPPANLAARRSKIRKQQRPLFLPNLAKIPVSKLENYFIVLSACEQNLQEFRLLKEKLVQQFQELEESNDLLHTEWDEDIGDLFFDTKLEKQKVDDFAFDGDVMSSLITFGTKPKRPLEPSNRGREKLAERNPKVQPIRPVPVKESVPVTDLPIRSSDAVHLQGMLNEKMRYQSLYGRKNPGPNKFLDDLLDAAAYGEDEHVSSPANRIRRKSTLTSLVRMLNESTEADSEAKSRDKQGGVEEEDEEEDEDIQGNRDGR